MKKIFLTAGLLICTCLLFAQQVFTVKVTDAKTGNGISSASAKIKSTKKGATANSDGILKIEAKINDVIEISSIGYEIQNITLTNQPEISVTMKAASVDLGDIVILGTRGAPRAKTETAVPVDVIKINQVGLPTAKMNLTSVLNMAAPSFNYNKQSGADGADHVDLGTLRGLGPDQTLVLINGKRRHQTAFVALFGTRGRGNSGVDLNGFPQSEVDRIEILRDGASAQYGSDAIAGVINIVLKKDINHWTINTGWSGYYDTKYNAYDARASNDYISSHPIDGSTFAISANNGLALGKKGGFINFSLDLLTQAKTYRQVRDTNLAATANALPVNSGRRAFGDGSVSTAGAMYNMELPVGTSGNTTFYSFGGYNYKASDAFAYSRNLSARPDRFPIDASGNPIYVPSIMHTTTNGSEKYFNPHIQTQISDGSLALGLKGKLSGDWNWDLSNTLGRNNFHYFGDKTFNASLVGNTAKTHFDDGGFNFLQNTLNIDFSKSFGSVAEGLNLGLGGEYRYERYSIYKGEEASYKSYPNSFGQAPGSQGFPGFSPSDVISANRSTESMYADAELNVTKKWLLDMALRFEYYSDFGFVNTSKIATRYKISDKFNIRGSVSTGFRAPSLQQINFNNTLTSFSGGQLVQSLIARNGSATADAAGIPKLTEETSDNASIGFAWKPMRNLTITVDGYAIKVTNRIVLSGLFSASDTTLPAALIENLKAANVSTAQFFDNAVNTTNFGLDIVIDYTKKFSDHSSIKALLAGNLQHMNIDKVNVPATLNTSYRLQKTFFSDREEAFLLSSAPTAKFNLNLEYTINKLGVGANFTYYGYAYSKGFGWTGFANLAGTGGPGDPAISGSFAGIDPYVDEDKYLDANFTGNGVNILPETFKYDAKITTDLFVSYKFSKCVSLFIGADNLFNVHPNFAAVPQSRRQSFDNETGGAWESVQMGFNGRRLFTKLAFNF